MPEKVRRWKPIEGIGGRYWQESVSDNKDGLFFMFYKEKEEATKIRIILDDLRYSYKVTDESYKLEGHIYLDNPRDIEPVKWCFYIVEDSSYIKLLSKESGTLSEAFDLKHYCIMSENEVLDIISISEPIIEFYVHGKLIKASRKYIPDTD